MYGDLREFIREVDQYDEVKTIEGADWDLEIGLITELSLKKPNVPLLIFDRIKGYEAGYRVVTNTTSTPKRTALVLGFPPETKGIGLVKLWRDKLEEEFKPVSPVELKTGAIKEEVHLGADVDLFEFPVPKWHELDGGRYIGTGDMVIQKDPDTGWVNLGTYRVQVMDRAATTISIVPGHHGAEIARKYWSKGLGCPVAVVCGQDPLLWTMACTGVPRGTSEYDYAGWIRNEPVKVVKGLTVDLPVPANSEIVLEGEFLSPKTGTTIEGPFGEWWGYNAGRATPHPIFKVKAICHRKGPIIMGAPPLLPVDHDYGRNIIDAAHLWKELDRHFGGIQGVWLSPEARGGPMCIVSIRQQFPGHARHVAASVTSSIYCHKFAIVVDEDIDPSNTAEVLWALGTRCEPENAIDIMRGFRTMAANPLIDPEKRKRRDFSSSRALIYACKPYSWIKDFPPSVKSSAEALKKTEEKWAKELSW